MKFAPVRPAAIEFDDDGTPRAPAYGDVYHARAGALEQARAVFLEGNGLPHRWAGRERFVILETGFGLGHNFLATWQAWLEDARRPQRLFFVSIEKHPARAEDLCRAHHRHAGSPLGALAEQLQRVWPEPSPDLHVLRFEDGRVNLMLAHADVNVALRELRLQADACFLDGFSPDCNETMWSAPVLKAVARLTSEGGTAATWCAASSVRHGLRSAGFDVERRAGFAGKREMTVATRVALAQRRSNAATTGLTPAPLIEANRSKVWPGVVERSTGEGRDPVIIVGAGLAGAACAQALARAGRPCTVLDEAQAPAQGASGNPAGLMHGVVHAEDGAHARLSRAAAMMAWHEYQPLIESGVLLGQLQGLRRREDRLNGATMQALLDRLGLPSSQVQALEDPRGVAWWRYPRGGWIDPGAWVHHALSQNGVEFRGGQTVTGLQREGSRWIVLGPQDQVLATGTTVVLCNAAGVLKALPEALTAHWPLGRTRGQITRVPNSHGVPQISEPLSGSGYAMTLPGGDLLCGSTTSRDEEAELRQQDHALNLSRARGLLHATLDVESASLGGRVGWRFQADDRLPLAGPVPRESGLFLCTALGSRGITWAPLLGAVLASCITGDPAPLPVSLLRALDPVRFERRRARRTASAAA